MELRHLRYFVTVAEELNISRASARLRISQPAVSRQLRDLEDELGVDLFRREKSGLKLTPAGETFLAHARDLLRRSGDAVKQMESFGKRAMENVTVGYIAPVLASILTPALRRFSQRHPNTEVALREMPPGEQLKALREGRIDLALIGNPCPEVEREFAVIVLTRIPFQAVLPDNHLLALRKRIALSELEAEPFVGFAEEKFPGRNAAICTACQAAGFTPRFRHHVENLSALLATVAAGKGVTLAPAEVSQLPHPKRCSFRSNRLCHRLFPQALDGKTTATRCLKNCWTAAETPSPHRKAACSRPILSAERNRDELLTFCLRRAVRT